MNLAYQLRMVLTHLINLRLLILLQDLYLKIVVIEL